MARTLSVLKDWASEKRSLCGGGWIAVADFVGIDPPVVLVEVVGCLRE